MKINKNTSRWPSPFNRAKRVDFVSVGVLIGYISYGIMTGGARDGLPERTSHSTEVGPGGSGPVDNPPTSLP